MLLHRFPNMNRDTASDMTCASMLHLFDYPAPAKVSPYFRGRWRPKAGPGEGEVLGAVFDREKLALPLLEAIQQYAREATAPSVFICLTPPPPPQTWPYTFSHGKPTTPYPPLPLPPCTCTLLDPGGLVSHGFQLFEQETPYPIDRRYLWPSPVSILNPNGPKFHHFRHFFG